MRQQNRIAVRWLLLALVFGLVSACSEASSSDREVTTTSSPGVEAEATPTASSPSPAPSSAVMKEPPATVAPAIKSEPSTPQNKTTPRTTAIASKVSSGDTLQPTFRATPRMAGFSADGSYYIYLESSRDTGAGIPKSSLQMIDVSSGNCVENGCIETRYGEVDARLDTKEAEDDLLKQTWKVRQELKLTPPTAGTELPVLSRSRTTDGTETVTLRLKDSDQPLQLRLRQKRVGTEPVDSKAAMQLELSYGGQQRSLGSLTNFKDFVFEYSIRSVKLSPDGKRVAVLLTASKPTFEGTLGTTLVHGFELQ